MHQRKPLAELYTVAIEDGSYIGGNGANERATAIRLRHDHDLPCMAQRDGIRGPQSHNGSYATK